MVKGNIYKPRHTITFKTKTKTWPYKNSYLRRFYSYRGRRAQRGGLIRRCVRVATTLKWTENRRFFRPLLRGGFYSGPSAGKTAYGRPKKRGYRLTFWKKQQLRAFHGKRKEEAFRHFFRNHLRKTNRDAKGFYSALESRLARVFFRRRFLPTVFACHQFIHHYGLELNSKKLHAPATAVSVGDRISVSPSVWKSFYWDLFCRVYYRRWGLYVRRRRLLRKKKKHYHLLKRRFSRARRKFSKLLRKGLRTRKSRRPYRRLRRLLPKKNRFWKRYKFRRFIRARKRFLKPYRRIVRKPTRRRKRKRAIRKLRRQKRIKRSRYNLYQRAVVLTKLRLRKTVFTIRKKRKQNRPNMTSLAYRVLDRCRKANYRRRFKRSRRLKRKGRAFLKKLRKRSLITRKGRTQKRWTLRTRRAHKNLRKRIRYRRKKRRGLSTYRNSPRRWHEKGRSKTARFRRVSNFGKKRLKRLRTRRASRLKQRLRQKRRWKRKHYGKRFRVKVLRLKRKVRPRRRRAPWAIRLNRKRRLQKVKYKRYGKYSRFGKYARFGKYKQFSNKGQKKSKPTFFKGKGKRKGKISVPHTSQEWKAFLETLTNFEIHGPATAAYGPKADLASQVQTKTPFAFFTRERRFRPYVFSSSKAPHIRFSQKSQKRAFAPKVGNKGNRKFQVKKLTRAVPRKGYNKRLYTFRLRLLKHAKEKEKQSLAILSRTTFRSSREKRKATAKRYNVYRLRRKKYVVLYRKLKQFQKFYLAQRRRKLLKVRVTQYYKDQKGIKRANKGRNKRSYKPVVRLRKGRKGDWKRSLYRRAYRRRIVLRKRANKVRKRLRRRVARIKTPHLYIPRYLHRDFRTLRAVKIASPSVYDIHYSFRIGMAEVYAFYHSRGF